VRDVNGDGLIGSNEIFFDPFKEFRYVGSSAPTRGASLSSDAVLFGRIRLGAQLEYSGGAHLLNHAEQLRCQAVCAGVNLTSTSLDDKADAAAARVYDAAYFYGFIQDASFLKLRELSIGWIAPARWARAIGATGARLTLSARNLGTWSKYRGADPEVNRDGQDNFRRQDLWSQPQVRYFVLRVEAAY
jgi:hypothetical protein